MCPLRVGGGRWGEPVLEFIACLEQHARDRSVDLNTTGYWASGYALSQWNVEDLSRDPLQSCFAKAMRLSDGGAVTIVDKSAACFDRTWVLYEQYLICTVRDERRDTATPFKWDLYTACHHKLAGELTVSADDGTANKFTAGVRSGTTTVLANMSHNKSSPAFFHNREAVGLTDGIGSGTDRDLHSKALREKHFPQALLTTALTKRVRNGAATSAQDHARLLNSLAGAADLNAAPAKTHNGYNMADALVHGSLAVNCLVHGINTMPSPLFPAVLEGMRGNTSTREFTFPFEAEGVNGSWFVGDIFLQQTHHGRPIPFQLEGRGIETASRAMAANPFFHRVTMSFLHKHPIPRDCSGADAMGAMGVDFVVWRHALVEEQTRRNVSDVLRLCFGEGRDFEDRTVFSVSE